MTGYTKLFGTLVGSTLWRQESKETKIVWITMLAMANKEGVVECSIPGLADFAKVDLSEVEEALHRLSSPDEYSRTPDYEGRRIEKTDGGWQILNYNKYREKLNLEDRREYFARKQAEYRDRKAALENGKKALRKIKPHAKSREENEESLPDDTGDN